MKRILLSAAFACLAAGPALADDLSVIKDQSTVVRLASPATTVVVGNPAIADINMQDGTTAFITGKAFGTTNIIAMDANGRQIATLKVVVTANTARSVTLMRGANEVTLSCAPSCQVTASSGAAAPAAAAPAPSAN